jgi:hypothetical protein
MISGHSGILFFLPVLVWTLPPFSLLLFSLEPFLVYFGLTYMR